MHGVVDHGNMSCTDDDWSALDEYMPVCSCSKEADSEESCDVCEGVRELGTIEKTQANLDERSVFDGIGEKLANVKAHDFLALVSKAYASVGDQPFMLKTDRNVLPDPAELKDSATAFYEYLQDFLDTNKVLVTEIPEAFDLVALQDVADKLLASIESGVTNRIQRDLSRAEVALRRTLRRADYMAEYLEVLRDTTEYPIGVLWCYDTVMKKDRTFKDKKLKVSRTPQADATRVDPRKFWVTKDWTYHNQGRAAFTTRILSRSDVIALKGTSGIIDQSVDAYIEGTDDGFRMPSAALFFDDLTREATDYEVLITRGLYKRDELEGAGVKPETGEYTHDTYLPAEVWISGSYVLQVRILPEGLEDFGVYTTSFRRWDDSIFGLSLREFITPFARMYESTIKGIDSSVGKSTGSIIMIDNAVVDDVNEYMTKNEKTGEMELDLSGDLIIEFDSTEAAMSPNFKGVPIHIKQLPSDIQKLVPVLSLIKQQLDDLTKIPSVVGAGGQISSALRTEKMLNQAYQESGQAIQGLLREAEARVLKPSLKFFFYAKAIAEEFSSLLLDANPEILLNDRLVREHNDDRRLVQNAQELLPYAQQLPVEELNGLINMLGREVYGYSKDIIPSGNPLGGSSPAIPTQPVNPA